MGMRKTCPMLKSKPAVVIARATPVAPHNHPDSSHATSLIRSVSMPQLWARIRFEEVARIARPRVVWVRRRCSASIKTTASATIATWLAPSVTPSRWKVCPPCSP